MNKLSWAASVGAGFCLVVVAQWMRQPAEPSAAEAAASRPAASVPQGAASGPAHPAASGAVLASAPPSSPLTKGSDLFPPNMGSEGLGPHIQRDIDAGTAESLDRALRRMHVCANPQNTQRMADDIRAEQWGGAAVAKAALEAIGGIGRSCQTVTPELLAQRTALAERLVALQWPGAVRTFEATLDRPRGTRYTPAMQQQLATWHRTAGSRGDEPSLHALASFGSIYGIPATEARAWGHLVQRCYPAGLRATPGHERREPFLFMEQQPGLIKAFADRGLPVPPADAKLDADARTLAASWPCPTPAN